MFLFPSETYAARRLRLRKQMQSGVILFLGHEDSPINYGGNTYPFRQDSSFLYYFGLDVPHLAAVIDVDEGREYVFGDDATVDEIVWTGSSPTLAQQCERIGIRDTQPFAGLQTSLSKAGKQGRRIHFLPAYRAETTLQIGQLLGIEAKAVAKHASEDLIRTVVAQRSVKDDDEVAEIDSALETTYEMQMLAMRQARPGRYEREIVADMEHLVLARGLHLAFPTIFTIHGQTLHQQSYGNRMKAGDIAVNDCGAESAGHYAGDITRTIPVGGRFSPMQREIYSLVLQVQQSAVAMIKPGIEFRDVHRRAGVLLLAGLKELGLVKGDPEEAVSAGAHTLFFPCGVGHMLGLDVHDMDPLGEDYIGYTDTIKRNPEFGWRWLRLAKALEVGYVLTVEPGIYFIPELIDQWEAEHKCRQYIHYDLLGRYRDFGGVRIEDDVLVTQTGHRVLGRPVPKAIEEVEAACSSE